MVMVNGGERQRWSRGHKARGQGHKKIPIQGQPFRGQTLSRPRTQRGSDLRKKRSLLQKFVNFPENSSVLQEKKYLHKIFR